MSSSSVPSLKPNPRLGVVGDEGEDNNDCIEDLFSEITIVDIKSPSHNRPSIVTHIVVLVHGWMGEPLEMGYIS